MKTKIIYLISEIAETISSRDAIRKIVDRFINDGKLLVFDFEGVQFISRSAAHELLKQIDNLEAKGYTVKIKNRNSDIIKMFDLIIDSFNNKISRKSNIEVIHHNSEKEFFEFLSAI